MMIVMKFDDMIFGKWWYYSLICYWYSIILEMMMIFHWWYSDNIIPYEALMIVLASDIMMMMILMMMSLLFDIHHIIPHYSIIIILLPPPLTTHALLRLSHVFQHASSVTVRTDLFLCCGSTHRSLAQLLVRLFIALLVIPVPIAGSSSPRTRNARVLPCRAFVGSQKRSCALADVLLSQCQFSPHANARF